MMPAIVLSAARNLRVQQVAATLAIGVSSVWRLSQNDPEFPKPFKLSPRVTVWSADEIDVYIRAKADQRSNDRGRCE